jgi:type I restriction enzyme S subunit
VRRLKSVVTQINDQTTEGDPGRQYIALEHVESWTGRLLYRGNEVGFDSQVKRFNIDDVLFGKLRPYLAKVIRPTKSGVCVSEFLVLRANATLVYPAYLEAVLRSKPVIDAVNISTFGAKMPRAEWGFVGCLPFPLPPLREQAAIVRFLDHVDRRIRRYIAAKKKLIALLNEQKQAIIQRAVTRGLDPNVRLKPSGVEWLGDVPEHWAIKRAKYYLREIDEPSATGDEELLSVSHITGVTPRSQKNITMFMASSYAGHKLCQPGDLAVNTMWVWMGALGVAKQSGIVSPSYNVYRLVSPDAFVPDYLDCLLRTKPYVSEYVSRSTGIRSSRLRVYPEEFLRICLIRPPYGEQMHILETMRHETRQIAHTIAQTQYEIDLIREYRTRLIADVVTGKLDVREAAARLPEETDEPEIADEDGLSAEVDSDLAAIPEEVEE